MKGFLRIVLGWLVQEHFGLCDRAHDWTDPELLGN